MAARVAARASPPAGLWPPSSQSSTCGAASVSGPVAQALHPGGPVGAGDGGLAGVGVDAEVAQGGEGGAGVLDLVRAGEVGQRQVEQAGLVLVDHAAAFGPDVPVLAVGQQRRAEAGGAGLDHREALVGLRADDAGHAALEDAGLFGGDLGAGCRRDTAGGRSRRG